MKKRIYKKIILIGGIAGSGKTTISEYISHTSPFIHIDKDKVTRTMLEELLIKNGKEKDDRESKTYVEKVRPFEYKQFFEIIYHLSEANYIIASAPFLKEFQDEKWIEEQKKYFEKELEAHLIIIWVETDVFETKERLIKRGASRDKYKLEHFEEYAEAMKNAEKNIKEQISKNQHSFVVKNIEGGLKETYDFINEIIYKINKIV